MSDLPPDLPQGTVTFLFTDIEGSTELARRLGQGFGEARSAHRRLLREAFTQHGGYELDTAGDGFFVAFERARDAVGAAVAAQRGLAAAEPFAGQPVRVRMGLHSAEPYLHEDGYVGVGVHRAARICAAGHGGQILLSNATAGIVEDLELEGIQLHDLGEHRLKDISRPQRLFQLEVDGLPSHFPPLATLDTGIARDGVVTVLMTDVRGWNEVLRTLGDEQAAAIADVYQRLVGDVVRAHRGRELETVADNVLAGFERPSDALRAAVDARHKLRAESWFPGGDRPAVCMAIHSGRSSGVARQLGSVVVRCNSLCHAAAPWQILVSHATESLLEGEPLDVSLRDLGERVLLKDDRPVRVFEIV